MALSDYEIRTGRDGKRGIYLRSYNVRLAVFNANSTNLQNDLAALFQHGRQPTMQEMIEKYDL